MVNPTQSRLRSAGSWIARELGLHTMATAGADVYIIILMRYLRLFAYGSVALVLALYFRAQGLSDAQIGFFMTLTLLGDVVVSLLLTLVADHIGRRRILMLGALGMATSGIVFAVCEHTWYVAFAVLGTSTGLIVGGQAVDALSARPGWTELDAYRAVFWIYTAVGLVKATSTLFLSQSDENGGETEPLLPAADDDTQPAATSNSNGVVPSDGKEAKKRWNPFASISPKSRAILLKLCGLFFLDSLGSGMVPFSLINYYLDRKFSLPKGKLGGIMSATWFLSTFGNIFSASLSRRLGLIPAMVVTHLPSSLFLGALPAAPNLGLTVVLLIGRSMMSSMDQAPRSAFISMVVLPEERTAVMGIVNTLKILSQSAGPWITGVLAGGGRFWVAFVVAGGLKVGYDILLLGLFGGKVHARKEHGNEERERVGDGGPEAAGRADAAER
ncbi:para-aminobenzoate synthase, (PABA) [Didymella keratinophila]|nr:para-aminobenzoate synthase, (PABA) [Didymella keratinophila]